MIYQRLLQLQYPLQIRNLIKNFYRLFFFILIFNQITLDLQFFQANAYLILYRGDDIQDIMKYVEKAFNNLMVVPI